MRNVIIPQLDTTAMTVCRDRIDNLTKPIYSLANLEKIAERLAGIYGVARPNHLRYAVMIFCNDHLIDGPQNRERGSVSRAAVERFNAGRTGTQGAAQKLKAPVYVVDVGLSCDTSDLCHIYTEKIMDGSHFFGIEPSMSEMELNQALEVGFAWADRLHAEGVQAVAIGNIGERAFLDSLIVTSMITGDSFETLLAETDCGPTIEERAKHIHSFIDTFKLNKNNILDVLRVAGGPDLVALTSFILGAASHRMAIVFDNAVTGAAVLTAIAMDDKVRHFVFPSAAYAEPIHEAQMRYLEIKPYLYYDLNIDEALGSTMGLSLLEASMYMLNDMKTFTEAEVDAAEDGPGNARQKR